MKYLDFEKHIKNELAGSKEPVQMDALLGSLNLGKEPTSKGFALWMILPFLLLVVTGFAWDYMNSDKNANNDLMLTKKISTKENYNQQNSNADHNVKNEINSTTLVSNENTENKSKINNKVEIKKTAIKSSKNKKSNSSDSQLLNRPPANNEIQQKNNLQPSNQIDFDDLISGTNLNSSYIQKHSSNTNTKLKETVASINDVTARATRDLLDIRDIEKSVDLLGDNEVDDKLFSRMRINCPSFDNAAWHLALIPEIGIFLPKKTLGSTSLEDHDALSQRLKSESTLEGLELGLYGMLVRDNVPFYLKAGISYSRISERMDLKYEYTEIDTSLGVISTTVSSNGDTITHIYGDIYTETTFKGSNRQHYYIHLFDIPISVGYTSYIAGLDIGIEAGVKINFMTRGTGNLLTSQKDYTNLSLNRLYKNKIGLSYFGGLMIGRNFGRFGDIYIAPRFTYYPNEFNNANNNVSQKYFTIGLNAGIVYKIN